MTYRQKLVLALAIPLVLLLVAGVGTAVWFATEPGAPAYVSSVDRPSDFDSKKPWSESGGDDERAFLDHLNRLAVPHVREADQGVRDNLVDLGRQVCTDLDNGTDIDEEGVDIHNEAEDIGWTMRDTGHVVGASIEAFCPRHGDLMN